MTPQKQKTLADIRRQVSSRARKARQQELDAITEHLRWGYCGWQSALTWVLECVLVPQPRPRAGKRGIK